MSRLNELLKNQFFKNFAHGMTKSHVNVLQLSGKGKELHLDNIQDIYRETLDYYNAGFARETGLVHKPEEIAKDYVTFLKVMFIEELREEKTIVSITGIDKTKAHLDYSMFCLYVLLINFKKVRVALWENFHNGEMTLKAFFESIYNTSKEILYGAGNDAMQLSYVEWAKVATNMIWNIKQEWELLDE